jgi:hypothetical protein
VTWSIKIGEKPTSKFAEVINCQAVFRRLTKKQRAAVLNPHTVIHPNTYYSLVAHGLWEGDGLTEAGRLVAKWNQPKETT